MTKAVPLGSLQAFLDALAASNLLDAQAVAKLQSEGEGDPKALARKLVQDGRLTKWQAGQLLHGFSALTIGKYKLLDQLGVGELGRVYLAEHQQMGNKVAVKILARKYTARPEVLSKILAEARRISGLEHRNLSHMRDVDVDNDRYYFVIDYVDALDLQRIVEKQGPRAPSVALSYLRQAADALAFCHRNKVVHGGLKPSNLLVDAKGGVTVLDVGLACLAGSLAPGAMDESTEAPSMFAQAFHAPECSAKSPPDVRSDVYSLGAVLFFLVTGKPPLAGEESLQKLNGQAASIPESVQQLCRNLLATKPADRPATDQALLAAIDETVSTLSAASQAKAKPPAPPAKQPPAKPLPKAAPLAAAPAAAAPQAKKPPVAKALPLPEVPAAPAPAAEPASTEDSPFGGFSLNTGGGKKAAAAPPVLATKSAPPVTNKPPVSKPSPAAPAAKGDKAKPAPAGKPNLTLLIAGGVGGGVLVLALAAGLAFWLLSGGKGKEKELAKASEDPAVAEAEANPAASTETNPAPAAESNPAPPAETNPAPPAVEANPAPPVAVAPNPAVPANPNVPANPVTPPVVGTTPPATVTPPVTPMPDPAATTPAPTNPPAKNPPAKNPPAKTPPPKTTPAPPAKANPFEGFAKSVSLPKLPPPTATEVPADALAQVELGPMAVAPMAIVIMTLKGGEQAYKPGKNKFVVESADGGTALRDWDVRLEGNASPVTIAKISGKNEKLYFQWTPEGAKTAGAANFCNCALDISAGSGKHQVVLRQPVVLESPLLLGIDKVAQPLKINLDAAPDPKDLIVELVSMEGVGGATKIDKNQLDASKDYTFVWAGTTPASMPLGIKVDTLMSGKGISVMAAPHLKLDGMTKAIRYSKKEFGNLKGQVDLELAKGNQMLQIASKTKDRTTQAQQMNLANTTLEVAQKANVQMEELSNILAAAQNGGKIHVRVLFKADELQVELANTGGVPPPAAGPGFGGGAKK